MTLQLAILCVVLAVTLILFISGRIRMDLVALMVLCSLALSGILTPDEALSGFSSAAVVTVWAVYVLSAGLSRTGVANIMGRQVIRLAGKSELRLLIALMIMATLMSSVMNNIGVVALFLPVVMDICRRTKYSPARILLPLTQMTLLGGMITLIGTPVNILASHVLETNGLHPFGVLDFTPIGITLSLAGFLFILLIERRILPKSDLTQSFRNANYKDLHHIYDLDERLFALTLKPDSRLGGKTLDQIHLETALGFNVVAIQRGEQKILAPDPDTLLQNGDRLMVIGQVEQLSELSGWQQLSISDENPSVTRLVSDQIDIVEAKLSPYSQFLGETISRVDFRKRFGVNVLAILRDGVPRRTNLLNISLSGDDTLLFQTTRDNLDILRASPDLIILGPRKPGTYRLAERLLEVCIPERSTLAGKSLVESRLGHAFSLNVLGITRQGKTILMPGAEEQLATGDALIIEGRIEDVEVLHGLQELELDEDVVPGIQILESETYGMVEAMLHPRTHMADKTLRDIQFREKYGLTVLAIWSGMRAYRSNLYRRVLHFGDAMLLYGRREQIKVLATSSDFLLLTQEDQEVPLYRKAWLAAGIMGAVMLVALLGWLPVSIATITGAGLIVLTGCLSMNEAYKAVEFQTVLLIACMLPLGIAMQKTGAALLVAQGMVDTLGTLGPSALLAGFFLLTCLITLFMPNAAVVVLMGPIALNTAAHLGLSPYTFIMDIALATSVQFMLPISHPANLLILGPGGYRTSNYLKTGIPLTILVMLVTVFALPWFFPL
jgi:di/tricarboxylate transporter